jgi:lysophospholipase L1-like esterase
VPYEKSYSIENVFDQVHNSTAEIDYLDKLTAHITADAIPLVFVQTPEYVDDIASITVKTENNKLISRIAKKYGVMFLNYNDALSSEVNRDKQYFSDPGHLNYLGARTFSGMLSRDINKLLQLKQLIL